MRISDWSSDVCSSDLHDHAIEIRPQPFDDLLHTRLLAATFPRAERGVSGEQHALAEPDVRPLAEARERRYQQAFLTECRPVTLRIFKQAGSEEHTSELQSLMRISYAVFCLKKKTLHTTCSHNKP